MSNCNKCKTNKCSCNKVEFCGCQTKIDLLCSLYTGKKLDALNIEKGDSANKAFEKINTFLSLLQEPDPIVIENIGNGNTLYKDISEEYKYQFKSIVQGEGIIVNSQDDTLTISIDENYLISLIQQNMPGS